MDDSRELDGRQAHGTVEGVERFITRQGRIVFNRRGVVVTGDAFVGDSAQRDEMRRSLKASAVEMEGAAVAQVSTQLGVPFLVIRSITDSADGSTPDAYRKNLDAASRNAAALTLAVLAHLTK